MRRYLVVIALTTAFVACTDPAPDLEPQLPARVRLWVDAGAHVDAGIVVVVDAGALDAGGFDAGGFDAGGFDAGGFDAGGFDAGGFDAGELDAGELDAGELDAGELDAGELDAGEIDGGSWGGGSDAGMLDGGGPSDGGLHDGGGVDAGPQGCWPTAAHHRRVYPVPTSTLISPDFTNRTTIWFDQNGDSLSEVHAPDGGPFELTGWCIDRTHGSGGLVMVPAPWGFDAFLIRRSDRFLQIMPVGTASSPPLYSCTLPGGLSFPAWVGVPSSTDTLNWWVPVYGMGSWFGPVTNQGGVIFWNPTNQDGGFVDMGQQVWSVLPRSATETWALVPIDGGVSIRAATSSGPGATHHDVALPPQFRCIFTSTIDRLWCLGPDGQFSDVSDAGVVPLVPAGGDFTWRVATVRPLAPVVLLERWIDGGADYILVTEHSPPRVVLSTPSRVVPALGARADGGIFFGFWEPPYPRISAASLVWGDYCPP